MALLTEAVSGSSDSGARRVAAGPPRDDVTELRLALVCDGGVSLAIYMHGVTKELQNVVCAARAYDQVLDGSADRASARRELSQTQLAYFDALEASPTPTTVSIDVVSGTSAGGINGVFLAKGLTRNVSQDPLTKMWLEKADLKKLTHHHLPGMLGALLDTAVALPAHMLSEGWSPLDGDLMCQWLLEALAEMDQTPGGGSATTLLPPDHDLDLFVTTTSLRGYQRIFPSADGGAGEHDRTNRKVFHFLSGTPGPNARFGPGDNGGLAFAARCTSSFPGAFAPVDLDGFAAIAESHSTPFDRAAFAAEQLIEYRLALHDPFSTHFADGGLLDNSPFDHTIAAIAGKSAQGQVDRRIIHIDPDPGDWPPGVPGAPLPVEPNPNWANGLKTALGVRSSQSLVGDLFKLQTLNDIINRVGLIAADLEDRVQAELATLAGTVALDELNWQQAETLALAAQARVPAVAGELNVMTYERLRVAAIADMFAMDVAGALDYPPDTQQADFLRAVFQAYLTSAAFSSAATSDSLHAFFDALDLPYRERRLRFLVSGVNKLFTEPAADAVRSSLRTLKTIGWTALYALLDTRASAARSVVGVATEFLDDAHIGGSLVRINPTDFATEHAAQLASLVDAYRGTLTGYSSDSAAELWKDFTTSASDLPADARISLLVRYLGFPLWDSLIFPVISLSELPQFSPIKMQRFSPQEATLLHPLDGPNAPKLRGTAVHHFGGFFDREWRENDYLWGRLDAAELIVRMLGQQGLSDTTRAVLTAVLDAEAPALNTVQDLIRSLRQQLSAATPTG